MSDAERGAIVQGFGEHPAREMVMGGRKYATTMGCLDMILAKRKVGQGCYFGRRDCGELTLPGWARQWRLRGQKDRPERDRRRIYFHRRCDGRTGTRGVARGLSDFPRVLITLITFRGGVMYCGSSGIRCKSVYFQ